jgi:hypothetical protein
VESDTLTHVAASNAGDDFEQFFWGLLRRRYPPQQLVYLPATMGGDHGMEGYSTDGIAYQCYADRDSLTLRARTDKQKQKLYKDTKKLGAYAAKIEKVLGGLVLDYYFLVVPQFHAVELVAYANERAESVRSLGLPFISATFAILIKTPDDYPAEYNAALKDASAKAAVPAPEVDQAHVALFADTKPELVGVLEAKLAVLKQSSPGVDVVLVRDRLIRAFLAKEQVMDALRRWPDTWEAVERRRELRQETLELESELSPDAPDRRVKAVIDQYKADLVTNVSGVSEADAQRLAYGQVGEWIMRCPLHFRVPK